MSRLTEAALKVTLALSRLCDDWSRICGDACNWTRRSSPQRWNRARPSDVYMNTWKARAWNLVMSSQTAICCTSDTQARGGNGCLHRSCWTVPTGSTEIDRRHWCPAEICSCLNCTKGQKTVVAWVVASDSSPLTGQVCWLVANLATFLLHLATFQALFVS